MKSFSDPCFEVVWFSSPVFSETGSAWKTYVCLNLIQAEKKKDTFIALLGEETEDSFHIHSQRIYQDLDEAVEFASETIRTLSLSPF